jgi:hypothetical protein
MKQLKRAPIHFIELGHGAIPRGRNAMHEKSPLNLERTPLRVIDF